jgi:hypothetical protein
MGVQGCEKDMDLEVIDQKDSSVSPACGENGCSMMLHDPQHLHDEVGDRNVLRQC